MTKNILGQINGGKKSMNTKDYSNVENELGRKGIESYPSLNAVKSAYKKYMKTVPRGPIGAESGVIVKENIIGGKYYIISNWSSRNILKKYNLKIVNKYDKEKMDYGRRDW